MVLLIQTCMKTQLREKARENRDKFDVDNSSPRNVIFAPYTGTAVSWIPYQQDKHEHCCRDDLITLTQATFDFIFDVDSRQ